MIRTQPKRIRRMAARPDSAGSSSHIPDDVLFFQILTLLPVKCLVRFQSVCKSWRTTILSTHFIRCHLEHSRTRLSMVVVPRKQLKDYTKVGIHGVNFYSFQPGQSKVAELILKKSPGVMPIFSIPLHCDGLILLPCLRERMFVCNPATTEFVELPEGSHSVAGDDRVAFGVDPSTGKYKVARHFFRSYSETPRADGEGTVVEYSAGHEILTIGDGADSWKWKATVDPPYAINARTPICVPGFFYWSALHSITGHGIRKVCSHVILRFSLHDETFTVHPNPPSRFLSNHDTMCELGGKLCYVESNSQWDVDIWLAEDGPNLAWLRRCSIRLPIPRYMNVLACASGDRDKIFLSIDAFRLLKCDLRDGSVEEIIDMARDLLYDRRNGTRFSTGAIPVSHYMVPCVESLLRIRP